MPRFYHQIYWEESRYTGFTPNELADIIKAIADKLVLFNPFKPHEMVLHLEGDIEVKLGYHSRFIHISSPSREAAEQTWRILSRIVNGEEKEGDSGE